MRMKGDPDQRAVALGEYIAQHRATVRAAAAVFHISKSTVHKDVCWRLRRQAPALWAQVHAVLAQNKAERHLRGGEATREKYARGR
jgi:putative DeoR family transcriptional regulator (stage III sporulation protein D)